MSEKDRPTKTEQKFIAAVRKHPGLFWYDYGAIVYPASTRSRISLTGKTVRDVYGRALTITHQTMLELGRRGIIRSDKEHRHFIAKDPR